MIYSTKLENIHCLVKSYNFKEKCIKEQFKLNSAKFDFFLRLQIAEINSAKVSARENFCPQGNQNLK